MKSWMLVAALCLVVAARGALVDFSLKYQRVEMKNGKVLLDVTFRSCETTSGKVSAVSGKNLLSVRLVDLPDDVAAAIRERLPVQTAEEIAAEKKQAADNLRAAKRRALSLERNNQSATKLDRDAQRRLDVKRAEVAIDREAAIPADIAAAAQQMAEHYFKYDADPNSSAGYVFDSEVLLEDPEQVPGWPNRWRVRGKVGIQYLTRNIGAVGRSSKEFEVLLEAQGKGKPKLVDITVSR